jgi:hypothetical protein
VKITREIKLLRMSWAGDIGLVRAVMRNERKRDNFGGKWIDGRK